MNKLLTVRWAPDFGFGDPRYEQLRGKWVPIATETVHGHGGLVLWNPAN